jgi:MEMO1 family protein
MVRKPAVAGQFYASTEKGLRSQIEASYRHTVGPGTLPRTPNAWPAGTPWAYVVPHAGYVFSGPVAAHAFFDVAKRGMPETVVILGPSHHRIAHPLAVSLEAWATPFGSAEVDHELAKQLVSADISHCDEDFALEHSLEVEVPFLQHLKRDVKIVPLIMLDQSLRAARLVGDRLAAVLAKSRGRSIGILASTDFTHYETADRAAAQDKFALDAISRGSAEELDRQVRARDISMCGPGPTMALLHAMKPAKTQLLKYANSADAEYAPMDEVVAYASIRVA